MARAADRERGRAVVVLYYQHVVLLRCRLRAVQIGERSAQYVRALRSIE